MASPARQNKASQAFSTVSAQIVQWLSETGKHLHLPPRNVCGTTNAHVPVIEGMDVDHCCVQIRMAHLRQDRAEALRTLR
jgi:hypothetical protein